MAPRSTHISLTQIYNQQSCHSFSSPFLLLLPHHHFSFLFLSSMELLTSWPNITLNIKMHTIPRQERFSCMDIVSTVIYFIYIAVKLKWTISCYFLRVLTNVFNGIFLVLLSYPEDQSYFDCQGICIINCFSYATFLDFPYVYDTFPFECSFIVLSKFVLQI